MYFDVATLFSSPLPTMDLILCVKKKKVVRILKQLGEILWHLSMLANYSNERILQKNKTSQPLSL